jgi:arginine utilization protein RocB
MIKNSPDLATRAREIALKLTSWPSVTGTKDEAEFANRLAGLIDGFNTTWTEAIEDDAAQRSNVFALKRGRTNRTVVLTGHFDVVPVADFGSLEPLAFDPEKLLPEIIVELKVSGENPLALEDFESGAFLPGRGLLDMKAGLAAGLAAAEFYEGDASILFVAVSDEEDRSAGARSAAPRLREIAMQYDLEIALVINLDAISDQGDGSTARVVTFGSIGKLLLTAFVVGKEAHAGYPQDGANAAYLAAELIREFELSQELSETTGPEVAAPPTCLHAKDVKQGYNVTTPAASWVYWNTMQHKSSAADVLKISRKLAMRAMERATQRVNRAISVMTYRDVAKLVKDEEIKRIATQVDALVHLDLPERCKLFTEQVWLQSGLVGPVVVLGFGSIPYPAVSLSGARLERKILDAVDPFGLGSVKYFAGISDMSFFGEASGDLKTAAENTPIWGTSFTLAEPAGYPCINIGPWGRDYHHWLERLHAPYAFETLPRVLLSVIDAVCRAG